MALTPAVQEELFDEVITTLGGTLVDVELVESDLLICFKKAVRTFQQKGHNSFRRQFMVLPVTKDETVYQIPSIVNDVVRIIKPSAGSFNGEDAFSVVAYNDMFGDLYGGGCSSCCGFDFLSYELTLDKIERMNRMSAYEAQFIHDRFRNTLTFLKKPGAARTWFVECFVNLEDDEYAKVDWIIRWTVAEAKHMLGMAYRKFGTLPGPTGETNLSGSEYLNESAQEKEQLLEDILNFVDGESDFMEIRFG